MQPDLDLAKTRIVALRYTGFELILSIRAKARCGEPARKGRCFRPVWRGRRACAPSSMRRANPGASRGLLRTNFTPSPRLFTNGQARPPGRLRFSGVAWCLVRRIQGSSDLADQAPAFNPLAHAACVSAEQGAAEHKGGGLGVLLVSELSCTAGLRLCVRQESRPPDRAKVKVKTGEGVWVTFAP